MTAAARIVPEWVEYDNEIKELLRRRREEEDAAAETEAKTPSSSLETGSITLFLISSCLSFVHE